MNKINLIILLSLLIFLVGFKEYNPLSQETFSNETHSVEIDGHKINYDSNIIESSYTHLWIDDHLRITSEKLIKFAEKNNYSTTECRPVTNLNVYVVETTTLNDRELFHNFVGADSNEGIVGLFDQMPNYPQNAAIILTDQYKYNEILFAHELSHYWAYRLCWDFHHNHFDGEKTATNFENFYISGE